MEILDSQHILQNNDQRRQNARIALFVVIGVLLLQIISELAQLSVIEDMVLQDTYNTNSIEMVDWAARLFALLYLLSYLLSAVLFLMWFFRAFKNLHALNIKQLYLTFKPGWAVGCWFVPFVNLAAPYRAAKEMLHRYRWLNTQTDDVETVNNSEILVGSWWALWILGGVFAPISNTFGVASQNLWEFTESDFMLAYILTGLSGLLIIASGAAAIKLIDTMRPLEQVVYSNEEMLLKLRQSEPEPETGIS